MFNHEYVNTVKFFFISLISRYSSNGILMIGGGNATNYLSTVEIYDVEQGFIKELSPMPTAR